MGKDAGIDWCDSSVNPTSGCDGCEILSICYANKLHEGRLAKTHPKLYAPKFSELRTIPGRMQKAAGWSDLRGQARPDKPWIPAVLPRLVFISDMSDALSKDIPFEYLQAEVVDTVAKWKHIGLWLTKRPKRMAQFARWLEQRGARWPVNLWVGTSITSRRVLYRAAELGAVPAAVRFLSVEPLLEEVRLRLGNLPWIDWVIVGGASGAGAPMCHLDWVRRVVEDCEAWTRSCFVKQLGSDPREDLSLVIPEADITDENLDASAIAAWEHHRFNARRPVTHRKGGDPVEWPEEFRRREFPLRQWLQVAQ